MCFRIILIEMCIRNMTSYDPGVYWFPSRDDLFSSTLPGLHKRTKNTDIVETIDGFWAEHLFTILCADDLHVIMLLPAVEDNNRHVLYL